MKRINIFTVLNIEPNNITVAYTSWSAEQKALYAWGISLIHMF